MSPLVLRGAGSFPRIIPPYCIDSHVGAWIIEGCIGFYMPHHLQVEIFLITFKFHSLQHQYSESNWHWKSPEGDR